jgi:hypothetical protein
MNMLKISTPSTLEGAEPMATAEIIGPVHPQYYLWWFPGSPVKVHLALSVVQRLKHQWLDAGPSSSQQGLLFGETRDGATEILDFQPATHGGIASMVEELAAERKRSLVGYYRTEKGEAFQLTAQDLSLARDCFAKAYNVFLLVHHNRFGPANATFFFHDRDCRMADFAYLEFPFDASLLAVEQDDRRQRSRQAIDKPIAVEPPVPPRAPVSPAAREVHHPKRLILRTVGWTVLLASGVAIGTVLDRDFRRDRYSSLGSVISNSPSRTSSPSVAPSASQPSMSLHAIRQNGDLELTWNRDSALIAAATSGALSIRDGEATRLVPFNAAQLRDGSLLYVPRTDQILMQLTVTTPAHTYTESVTVILPRGGEPRTYPVPSPPAPSVPVANSLAPSYSSAPVFQPSKRFTAPPPAKVTGSAVAPLLQDPPALNDKPTALAAIPGIVAGLSVLPPRPSTALPRPPAAPMQLQQPHVATYEPPVAVVKTEPKLPAGFRNLILKRTVIQVNIEIDRKGRVIHVESVPQKGISVYLVRSAIEAAWSWTFKPARSNDEPVPSKWSLQFVFNP